MTLQKIVSRDFILIFFTQFVFSTVFCILIPAIPIYLLRFGAKEGRSAFSWEFSASPPWSFVLSSEKRF